MWDIIKDIIGTIPKMIARTCKRLGTMARLFSAADSAKKAETVSKNYGNISDQDRIFSNLYKDQDPFIDGALKRVSSRKL